MSAPKPKTDSKLVEIEQTPMPSLAALQAGHIDYEWEGLRAIGRYIVCMRVDAGKSTTAAGVIIPDSAQMPCWVAISVGPDVVGVRQWDRLLMIFKQPEVICLDHKGHQFMLIPFELAVCVLPMPRPEAAPRIVKPNGHERAVLQ